MPGSKNGHRKNGQYQLGKHPQQYTEQQKPGVGSASQPANRVCFLKSEVTEKSDGHRCERQFAEFCEGSKTFPLILKFVQYGLFNKSQ